MFTISLKNKIKTSFLALLSPLGSRHSQMKRNKSSRSIKKSRNRRDIQRRNYKKYKQKLQRTSRVLSSVATSNPQRKLKDSKFPTSSQTQSRTKSRKPLNIRNMRSSSKILKSTSAREKVHLPTQVRLSIVKSPKAVQRLELLR